MIRIPSECADYANSNPDIGGVVRIMFPSLYASN